MFCPSQSYYPHTRTTQRNLDADRLWSPDEAHLKTPIDPPGLLWYTGTLTNACRGFPGTRFLSLPRALSVRFQKTGQVFGAQFPGDPRVLRFTHDVCKQLRLLLLQ
jgi:hypothetical protein